MIVGRALHYVFKIGDRARNLFFYKNILGMKVLRHEEFTTGCEAACNGPYDNRWSKTMVGYGTESDHFVIELTYNYGVKTYELGNDFGGITIKSKEVIDRAQSNNYPVIKEEDVHLLVAPDGYKFYIQNEEQPVKADPVIKIALNVTDLEKSIQYWNGLLDMKVISEDNSKVLLNYKDKEITLQLNKIRNNLNRATAYGRIAFAVPAASQSKIDQAVQNAKGTILKPLIKLDTPGKASVTVIILADPDGHEICFVDEEGFTELSQLDADSDKQLEMYITKDPFQQI